MKTSKVLPLFVAGNKSSILSAVEEGGALYDIKSVAYAYAKDTGHFCYIDMKHEIHWIVGANKDVIQRVDELPSVGDPGVFYIFGNVVYYWDIDNEAYYPTFRNVSERLDSVNEVVKLMNETIQTLADTIESQEEHISNIENQITEIEGDTSTKINRAMTQAIEQATEQSQIYSDEQYRNSVEYVNNLLVLREV